MASEIASFDTWTLDVVRTITAFANTDGGQIRLGVGRTTLDQKTTDEWLAKLHAVLMGEVKPTLIPFVSCRLEEIDHRMVLVIDVMRGTSRPYYIAEVGMWPDMVFVRDHAATVPLGEVGLKALIAESNPSFEAQRAENYELTFDELTKAVRRRHLADDERRRRDWGFVDQLGCSTRVAQLFSDQNTSVVRLTVFDGVTPEDVKARLVSTGSLIRQWQQVTDFLEKFAPTPSANESLFLSAADTVPAAALREAFLNALMHRDYSVDAPIDIWVLQDRIVVTSPGGPKRGAQLDDMLLGLSSPRYPRVAQMFERLGLATGAGVGLNRIRLAYQGRQVRPEFKATSHAFQVILPNDHAAPKTDAKPVATNQVEKPLVKPLVVNVPVSQPEPQTSLPMPSTQEPLVHHPESMTMEDIKMREILALLDTRETITRREVDEALGVSQSTASNVIRRMLELGLLRKIGSGRLLHYAKA